MDSATCGDARDRGGHRAPRRRRRRLPGRVERLRRCGGRRPGARSHRSALHDPAALRRTGLDRRAGRRARPAAARAPALDRSAGARRLRPPCRRPHRPDQPRPRMDRPNLVAAAGRRRAPPRQLRAARSRADERFPGAGPGHPGAAGPDAARLARTARHAAPLTASARRLVAGRAAARRGLCRGRARPSAAARRSGGASRPERVPLRARLPGVQRTHAAGVRRDAADRTGPAG